MPIQLIASGFDTGTTSMTTTGVTPVLSGAPQAGDLIIVAHGARGNRIFTASDEFTWSAIPNSNLNNGTNCDITGWYRYAGSGESTSQGNFLFDTASIHGFAIAAALRGVHPSNPFADTGSQIDSATSHDANLGGLLDTSTVYGLLWCWAAAIGAAYTAVSAGTIQESPFTLGGANIAGLLAHDLSVTSATQFARSSTPGGSSQASGFWVVLNQAPVTSLPPTLSRRPMRHVTRRRYY